MPNIIADLPAPARYPPVSGSSIAQSQSFDADLSGLARVAKGRSSNPRGPTQSDVARLLQIRCKFAAPKTKKPRICAANRENLLEIPCSCSKPARPSQGFRGFRPAAFRCQQQEQQVAKFAPRQRCLLLDFASTAAPRRIPR
jgi:hypothetical protein